MPELPEVESLRRSLEPGLLGRVLTGVRIHRRDVLTLPPTTRIRASINEHLLVNSAVSLLRRRGKQLAIVSDCGRCLVVHLGMTGQLLCEPAGSRPDPPSHRHITWNLDSGHRLCFRDPRRFGGVWALPSLESLESRWSHLGPDALDVSGDDLAHRASSSSRGVKALLLDQSILAGVGNIYADEALFLAGLLPTAVRLNREQWNVVAAAVRRVLSNAVSARGSTLRDYRDASGQPGSAQLLHKVYGRGGQPCPNCGKTLKCATIAQRTTVYCTTCQRSARQWKLTDFPHSRVKVSDASESHSTRPSVTA